MKYKLFILTTSLLFSMNVENRTPHTTSATAARNIAFADSVKLLIEKTNIAHPDIVYRQAEIETANFTSAIFRENNNLFGMRRAKARPHTQTGENKGYAVYDSWRESIIDMALWQSWNAKRLDRQAYIELLQEIYSIDTNYIQKLKIK